MVKNPIQINRSHGFLFMGANFEGLRLQMCTKLFEGGFAKEGQVRRHFMPTEEVTLKNSKKGQHEAERLLASLYLWITGKKAEYLTPKGESIQMEQVETKKETPHKLLWNGHVFYLRKTEIDQLMELIAYHYHLPLPGRSVGT